MPPQKPKPPAFAARMALPDAELRETLDLLAKVLASVSDRLDAQGEVLQYLVEAQPSPELMATASEKAVKGSLEPLMHQLLDVLADLTGSKAKLRQRLRIIQGEECALSRWSRLVLSPFFLPVLLVLALTLAFGAPRLLAGSDVTCWLIGGQWMQGNGGQEACVVWRQEAGSRQTEVSR